MLNNITNHCDLCPIGKFSNPRASECTSCNYASGYVSKSDGDRNSCIYCGLGKFADKSRHDCVECIVGKYSVGGVDECIDCDVGTVNNKNGSSSCSSCKPGSVPFEGECVDCKAGTHAPFKSTNCTSCKVGEYSTKASAYCVVSTNCGIGKYIKTEYTASTDSECQECPIGTSSVGGSTSCLACDHGFVAPAKGMTTCNYCGPGKHSNTTTNFCSSCLPSTYSSGGKSRCDSCPIDQYSDQVGASNCKFCVAGMIPSKDQKSCDSCNAGYFSNIGDTNCSVCVAGLYSSNPASPKCSYCQPGDYSSAASSLCSSCQLGKVSSVGASVCENCVKGKREEKNECHACIAGTFSDAGATSCDSSCPAGTYGRQGETTCFGCEAGKYSPLGSSVCELCHSGKWSNAAAEICSDCTPGRYTIGIGTVECAECIAGKKSGAGASMCDNCEAGTFSSAASETCHNSCEAGTYSGIGSSVCQACGEGMFSFAGAEFCAKCDTCGIGKFISTACTNRSDTICNECPAGTASFGGSTICTACTNPGEYSIGKSNTVCAIVGAGTIPILDRTGFDKCPANSFSVGASDTCSPCEVGSHSKSGQAACISTPPGHYWNGTNDMKCPASTYSSVGASDIGGCKRCVGAGEYSKLGASFCLTAGAGMKPNSDRTGTTECSANTYSIGSKDDCGPCQKNAFSRPKASNCDPCPQYQKLTGDIDHPCGCETSFYRPDTDQSICTCKKGTMLMGKSCEVCEIGRFKDWDGIDSCTLCEKKIKGSTTRNENSTTVDDCVCPKGTFLAADRLLCDNIISGVEETKDGMSLEFLRLMQGYWRTNEKSTDIRECPVKEACIGGNEINQYCRVGHEGPYCNLCEDGYSKDVYGLCRECETFDKNYSYECWNIDCRNYLFRRRLHLLESLCKE